MIVEKLLKDALNTNYSNFNLIGLTKIHSGLTNHNYKIKSNNGNILFAKVYRSASIYDVKRETKLINYLSKNGVLVPKIYKNNEGNDFTIKNKIPLSVSEYIEGQHPEVTTENASTLGRLIASVHRLPSPPYILQGYKTSYEALKFQIEESAANIDKTTKNMLLKAINMCSHLSESSAPKGIIHTDVFLDNCIKSNNSIIYLLDFEETVIDCFLFDIGRAILGCCSREGLIEMDMAHQFINSYSSVREFEPVEWDEIYHWVIFSILVSIMWRYMEFNINRPNEGKNNLFREFFPSLDMIVSLKKSDFIKLIRYG